MHTSLGTALTPLQTPEDPVLSSTAGAQGQAPSQEDRQVHLLVDTQTQAWEAAGQDPRFLLSGPELDRAHAWASNDDADPAADGHHRLFLEASDRLKNRRNYRALALVVGFFAAVVLGRALARTVIQTDAPQIPTAHLAQ